jgi:hypothetical protein
MARSNLARARDFHAEAWKEEKQPLHVNEWHARHPEGFFGLCYETQALRAPDTSQIEQAIEASRTLLDLPQGWDDGEAKQISKLTWDLATAVLREAARAAHRRFNHLLPAPNIGPCSDGSLDLFWDTSNYTLLINVQAEQASDYYGERAGLKIQGPFNPTSPKFDFLTLLVEP